MTPWTLLTAMAGLIAFHIGLFTLVGRERKSPYVINAVFPVFLLCLIVAALCITAATLPSNQKILLDAGAVFFIFAIVVSIYTVTRTTIRFVYFVDSVNPRHLKPVRFIRRLFKRKGPSYEHNPVDIPQELKMKIEAAATNIGGTSAAFRKQLNPVSMAVAVRHQGQANEILYQLARAFIESGFSVQYLTASRHPIEFISLLKKILEDAGQTWAKISSKIVVIDAYSPHFAFTDSWLPVKTDQLKNLGVTYVLASMTYAGMHSASARAFKKIKAQVGNERHRDPTLVIYEDARALSDLESTEQYRIFVRHVMPSERMWGGMFTVFCEACPAEGDWDLLQAYASIAMDLRKLDTRRIDGNKAVAEIEK
ncbi:hypothetical protein [Roseibium sp. M-1]